MINRKKKDRSRTKLNISSGVSQSQNKPFINPRPVPIFEDEPISSIPSTPSTPSPPVRPQFKYREMIDREEKDDTGINWAGLYSLYSDVKRERDAKSAYNAKIFESMKESEEQARELIKSEPTISVKYGSNDEYKYNVGVLNKLENEAPNEQIKFFNTPVSNTELAVIYGSVNQPSETVKIRQYLDKQIIESKQTPKPQMSVIYGSVNQPSQTVKIIDDRDERKYENVSISRLMNPQYTPKQENVKFTDTDTDISSRPFRTTGDATGITYTQPQRPYRTTGDATGISYTQPSAPQRPAYDFNKAYPYSPYFRDPTLTNQQYRFPNIMTDPEIMNV